MKEHTQGDRVYNRSGHEGEYIGKIENGPYLVRPVLECYRGDEEYAELGHLQEWEEIFDRAPVGKLDEQFAKKLEEIEEAKKALADIQSQIREWRNGEAEMKKRRDQYEELSRLDDFLAGRITHYVLRSEYGDYPSIVAIKDSIPTRDDDHSGYYEKRVCMLSFTGRLYNDEAQWTLSKHSKGQWDNGKVILCRSYEEAVEVVSNLLEIGWEKVRKGNEWGSRWMEIAQKHNLPIPEDVLEKEKARLMEDAQKQISQAENELARRKAILEQVSQSLVQP